MIRLICTDVDGTLLGSSGEVHPDVWRAADAAREAGILLAICSGRPGFGISRDLAERLQPGGWHIFQNGASVVHLASGESRSARVSQESLAVLRERARATGRILELYSDDDYVVESNSESARAHAGILGVPFTPRSLDSLAGPVVRAQWLMKLEDREMVLREPHPGLELSPSTSPMMPDHLFCNMTPAGVDKSTAVRAVAGEYGVPLSDVMYVGDGLNDVTAMRIVGSAVAMANAEHEARAVASHEVGHVDDAGLAEAFELAMAGRGTPTRP